MTIETPIVQVFIQSLKEISRGFLYDFSLIISIFEQPTKSPNPNERFLAIF